jgi:O-antigen/teichoic acid export membrane protein
MMSVKRNLVANYIGQGWSALISLAFLPLYIKYLGMESYGLIGLFATMQAWLVLLDLGMTPTLSREMARFTAGAHTATSIRNLLWTVEVVCLSLSTALFAAVWWGSSWLANDWLRIERLSTADVETAISLMALVLAVRFVESIYRSALVGLQHQVLYNVLNASLVTLRSVGAMAVLAWIQPTIAAFFWWQAAVSVVSVAALAIALRTNLPASASRARFSTSSLHEIRHFAQGMAGITLLAVLLTQIDKVLLSRLLPLESFGLYTLATTLGGVLYMLVTPITTALYPRLVTLHSSDAHAATGALYHRGAQLVTAIAAPVAVLLAVYGEGVVYAWSGNPGLARDVGPILSVICLGTFLNCLIYMPYQLQLAHGWTGLAMRTNAVAALVLVPSLFIVVPRYGVFGASLVWFALNLGYVVIHVHLMHRRLLRHEAAAWYLADVGLPLCAAVLALIPLRFLMPHSLEGRGVWAVFLAFNLLLAIGATGLSVPTIRARVVAAIRSIAQRTTVRSPTLRS